MDSCDMNIPRRLRILVVDNEALVISATVKNLEYWGYAAFCATGEGPELMRDAIHKAHAHRCHLALVDLRLLDDYDMRDTSGLDLIKPLEPTHTIIVTASTDSRMSTNALELGALGFVSKSEGPKILQAELEKCLKKLYANRSDKEIHWPADLDSAQVTRLLAGDEAASASSDQADDVLVRLFPKQVRLKIEPLKDNPITSSSLKIRPHSFVAQVRADANQPMIIKMARAARIRKEVENYESLVRDMLEGRFCPQLQDHCTLWDIGGAIYTLLGAKSIHTFSNIYTVRPVEELAKPLRQLLGEIWPNSYASTLQPQPYSLFEAYKRLWSTDWYTQLPAWPNPRPGLPEPSDWLRRHVGLDGNPDISNLPNQYSAVCHGDLHGDNLLVDHNGIPWVIDFERTGPGPVLADFVEFEADILNRLAGFEDSDQVAFERVCRAITEPLSLLEAPLVEKKIGERSQKALALAYVLRQIAAQANRSEDTRPYLWGLLFSTLFRAHLLQKQTASVGQVDRTYYLASQICARLDV